MLALLELLIMWVSTIAFTNILFALVFEKVVEYPHLELRVLIKLPCGYQRMQIAEVYIVSNYSGHEIDLHTQNCAYSYYIAIIQSLSPRSALFTD